MRKPTVGRRCLSYALACFKQTSMPGEADNFKAPRGLLGPSFNFFFMAGKEMMWKRGAGNFEQDDMRRLKGNWPNDNSKCRKMK